jgi:hypothetical protein
MFKRRTTSLPLRLVREPKATHNIQPREAPATRKYKPSTPPTACRPSDLILATANADSAFAFFGMESSFLISNFALHSVLQKILDFGRCRKRLVDWDFS